jgi:hypothetical protein
MFESAGFKVLKVESTSRSPVNEEVRAGLHADFQAYALDDLSILSALLVAQKQ